MYDATWRGRRVAVLALPVGTAAIPEATTFVKLGRHPHLVQFIGRTVDAQNRHCLITEFAEHGALSTLLQDYDDEEPPRRLSDRHLITISQQVADAMEKVHAEGLIHRDLAARNVLAFSLDPDDAARTLVKVSDYGLTTQGQYVRTAGARAQFSP